MLTDERSESDICLRIRMNGTNFHVQVFNRDFTSRNCKKISVLTFQAMVFIKTEGGRSLFHKSAEFKGPITTRFCVF